MSRPFVRSLASILLTLGLLGPGLVRAEEAPAPASPADAERTLIKRLVDELRPEAARIRGLPWKFEVPADLVTREQMRADFMAELDVEYPPAKRDRDLAILRRLGMLAPDENHVTLIMDVMQSAVGGYYDPKKKHLRIVEGFAGEAQKPVILHELVHALEDQHLDLMARSKPFEEDSDRTFAEKCLGEGSAEHARELYEKAHPEVAAAYRKAQMDPKGAMAQIQAMRKVPAYLFVATLMHYQNGPAFVSRAVRGGNYPERMAALYAQPPVSQEQILHPGRWFTPNRDYPQAIVWGGDLAQAAGEDWAILHQLPSGELDLALYLDFFLSPMKGKLNFLNPADTPFQAARRAAAGWDAGQILYLTKPGAPLVVVEAWAFDGPSDAWEAADALVLVAKKAAADAWKGGEWVKEQGAAGGAAKGTLDYANQYGSSRLRVEGSRVLRVDGADPKVLDRLWPVVLQTAFVRDARDSWDPSADARLLAASTFRDDARGLGVTPPAGWTAVKPEGPANAFAVVRHGEGDVSVTLIVNDRVRDPAMVLMASAAALKRDFPAFDGNDDGEGTIGEAVGLRAVLGEAQDGSYGEIIIAAGTSREFVARIRAVSTAALEPLREELKRLLASVVSVER